MAMDKAVVVAVMGLLCAPSRCLSQAQDDFSKSGDVPCFRGWTGRNSGGSCSWNKTLCDWEIMKGDDLQWELKGAGLVELDPDAFSGPQKGRLRSPPMCEDAGSLLCVQVKFKFTNGGYSQWYLQQCQEEGGCTNLLHFVYDDDSDWVVASAKFLAPEDSFRMVILGEKYYNGWGDESSIYIDYIRYNNASCGEEATGVTSLTTNMFPSSSWEDSTTAAEEVVLPPDAGDENENENATSPLKTDEQEGERGGFPIVLIVVGVSAALLVIIVIVVIVVVVVKRRNRKTAEKEIDTELAVRYDSSPVSNELYNCLPTTTLGDQQKQPALVTSKNGDVTSLPTTPPTDYDNINAQKAVGGSRSSGKSPADKRGDRDAVYDHAEHDEQDVYENTAGSGGEKEKDVYENTPLRQAEPATEAEYNHLALRNNRPDRRCDNYDRVK